MLVTQRPLDRANHPASVGDSHVHRPTRRSVLRGAGAAGLLTAGGALPAGCESAGRPAVAPSPSAPSSFSGPPANYFPVSSVHQKKVRPTWSQTFQSGHDWTAGGAGAASSDMNDKVVFAMGRQSARITTDGSGREAAIRTYALHPLAARGRMVRLVFRVEDVTHLHKLVFSLGTGTLASRFTWTFHTHDPVDPDYVQSGEWVTVHLQWADATAAYGSFSLSHAGAPSARSGFTAMSLTVYDDAKAPVTVHLQAVEILPDTSTVFPRGAVSITFDDSFRSVAELAAPLMKARGFSGTVYNIAEAIDTPRYMTLDQLRTLQDTAGWEIAGHAYTMSAHESGYSQLTSARVEEDFGKLRAWLSGNGFTSEQFAYPHGVFQATSDGVPVDEIASRHFASARCIISETSESLVPAMPYRLKAVTGINDGTGLGGVSPGMLTAAGAKLDRSARNGDWLVLAFHALSDGRPEAATQISQAAFARVLDAVAASGVPVVTVSQALSHYA